MYLVFDIGGTKMRIAATKDFKDFGEPKVLPTPQSFYEGVELFKQACNELSKGEDVSGVAGGIAGPLNKEKTMMVKSPNISHWADKPLKTELEKAFGAPVHLENDAALVGLGEAAFGGGKDKNIVVYMTISTGVGGSRFVDQKIDRNAIGFEPGHQILKYDGIPCIGCGGLGHLEGYISGKALTERYGKPPEKIVDEKVWDEVAQILAYGLNNIITHWSPEVIVLGGSVMKGIDIRKVNKYLRDVVKIYTTLPELKPAELGDYGGLYGAVAYLKSVLE